MFRNRDTKPSTAKQDATEQDAAEQLAITALGYLAADPHRFEQYLSLSGLDLAGLREAASSPGFLASVLDFLLDDESLLLAFAADHGLKPELVVKARARLAHPHEHGLREG